MGPSALQSGIQNSTPKGTLAHGDLTHRPIQGVAGAWSLDARRISKAKM